MTDPTPKPWWPPHAIRRHVQEPAPDAEPTEPPTWPEDAVQEVARLKDAIEWHMQEATDARVHAEQVEAALAQSEKARRGQQVQIEAQRVDLDAVRAALSNHPRVCDRHDGDDPVQCGWKRAVLDVERAILPPTPECDCGDPIQPGNHSTGDCGEPAILDADPAPEAGGDDE